MPQYNEGKVLWLILTECDLRNGEASDEEWIREYLRELVRKIRMTCLPASCSYTFKSPDPDKAGVSATQMLAESHVSVHPFWPGDVSMHTWPEARTRPCLTIVVYSCRKFRTDRVVKFVLRTLKPKTISVWETERKYTLCRKEEKEIAQPGFPQAEEIGQKG
jgi:S-adenosylmethionine/arginine decarboxylase-like enzyme